MKEFHVSRRAPTMHMHKIEVMEKGFLDYVYLELDTDLGNYLTPRLRVNPVIVIGGGVMDFHRNVLCLGVPTPGVEPASLCIPNPSHVFHFLNRVRHIASALTFSSCTLFPLPVPFLILI